MVRLHLEESFPFLDLDPSKPPYPILPVRLISLRGQAVEIYALLDSGADGCLFHAKWASQLGLELKRGRESFVTGIDPDKDLPCYIHRVYLTIGSNTVRCDVAFCEYIGDDINDNLIGRDTVFNAMRFGLRQRIRKTYVGSPP